MQRFSIFCLLLLLTLLNANAALADDADKIIDRYKKAVGGDAVKSIQSTYISGLIKAEGDQIGHYTYQSINPDHMRLDIDAGGEKLIESYNGISGWRDDKQGLRSFTGDEIKQLRLRALLTNTYLRDLSRYRITTNYVGKQTIDGQEVAQVEFRFGTTHANLFFNTKTALLVKAEHQIGNEKVELFFQDYRKIDKVMEPFAIKINRDQKSFNILIERVEHNKNLAANLFHYPKLDGTKPIPEVTALMTAITANQEKVQELRELYTFRETTTDYEFNDDNDIKKTEVKIYDVTPLSGAFIKRLVSVDGKELSASEREKEEKKFKKELEDIKKHQEKEKKEKEKEKAKGKEDDDDITLLTFLKIVDVINVHRDQFRGYEVIVFDFIPRKEYKPKNRAESIVSKLSGTFYVDEQAKQVVRLEARLTDSFKLAGGMLASISPSSAFVFEQEKIRDEIWLPSYAEANIGGKALLFVKFNQFTTVRYSDYKKYQTDVEIRAEE